MNRIEQYGVPAAIVIAGLLIAGAVYSVSGGNTVNTAKEAGVPTPTKGGAAPREITDADHVFGNRDASVMIVEYSDFECPFCARLHPTLARIVEESDGEVAWVYRHFPLTSIHSRAQGSAEASECIASLGGNDAFWAFTDALFVEKRSLTSAVYENIAAEQGISETAFRACVAAQEFAQDVRDDAAEAQQLGGRGTPFVVVMNADGETVPFSGALPYDTVATIVGQLQ